MVNYLKQGRDQSQTSKEDVKVEKIVKELLLAIEEGGDNAVKKFSDSLIVNVSPLATLLIKGIIFAISNYFLRTQYFSYSK